MCYVYIAECGDGSLYTGWTNDIEKRLRLHNEGRGARYTRCRLPVTLKYIEEYQTKSEALRREAEIKKLTRAEKQALAGPESGSSTI